MQWEREQKGVVSFPEKTKAYMWASLVWALMAIWWALMPDSIINRWKSSGPGPGPLSHGVMSEILPANDAGKTIHSNQLYIQQTSNGGWPFS